jgi:mycothiol synthase
VTQVRKVDRVDDSLRGAVESLVEVASRHDGTPALSDHLVLDLRSGGTAGFAGLAVGPDDDLTAYGQLSATADGAIFEAVVHPLHRSRDLVGELLRAASTEMEQRTGKVSWWVTEPGPEHERLASEVGLIEDRRLHMMRRPLPADRRAAVETRSFVVGADEEHWLVVNNRAFAGHAEQGGWTSDILALRESEDWFDPEGFRLHEREGRLAAFCWTKVHDPGTERAEGEIYVIAVDPDFHGLGLGRELTLAGLDHLADTGLRSAILYVAAENTAAVGLYESLGFRIATTRAAFAGDFPT